MASTPYTGYTPMADVSARLWGLAAIIGAMWVAHYIDPGDWAYRYGIIPRDNAALIGIVTAPILHGSFNHLAINSVFMAINFGQMARIEHWNFWGFLLLAWGMSYGIIWAIHPDTGGMPLVGASALIFAAIGFGLGISLAVGDWVGPAFLAAQIYFLLPIWKVMMLPGPHHEVFMGYTISVDNVSWVGHWVGLLVGFGIAHWKGTTW